MKFTTKISILILSLFASHAALAQRMKEPVSFKLKNGLTVIVAQNVGLGKVYSRLTIENKGTEAQRNAAQIFESYLNGRANTFNQNVNKSNAVTPQVSLTVDEANTSTSIADFEHALQFVADNFVNPELSQQAFDEMRSQPKGNKADLENVGLAEVKSFYANHFKASDAFITIAGDIDVATAKTIANRAFGNWKTEATLAK
ncbi:insulinase family protein [Pedobacter sp. KR3-3]|uniref:Insulinase family protein n=1 Tax=Pedobacter albus TaxID=3113905 RepID=A0ABU7I9G0_9SPHI|nr:insulinase family protein [Pedobacter sp. KR3-3]MEE1945926.1 insulinase family protein [Pedobacter sp. KR3-3]